MKNERSNNKKQPDASVIIPSYNHAGYISGVLSSLENQETDYTYEVIVVDSGDDETGQIVTEDFPWVRYIKLPRRAFPGEARNAGVEAAASDVILFTDTDCTVCSRWIDLYVSDQKKGKTAIAGPVKNGTPFNPIGTLDYLLEFYDSMHHRQGIKEGPVGTVNVSFHKSIFLTYGPLDDYIKGSDSRFSRKILAGGTKIHYNPSALVWHFNRTSLKKVLRNQFLLGKGAALTFSTRDSILLKFPVLIFLVPFIRSLRIGWILLRNSLKNWLLFLILYPLVLVGLSKHAYGFAKGSWGEKN